MVGDNTNHRIMLIARDRRYVIPTGFALLFGINIYQYLIPDGIKFSWQENMSSLRDLRCFMGLISTNI
jgi:hypothetical protein